MKLRDLPIARKLGLILVLNILVAVLSIALIFAAGATVKLYRDSNEQLLALAAVVAENSRAALAFGDPENARKTLAALGVRKDIVGARLYDAQGAVFARVDFPPRPGEAREVAMPYRLVVAAFPTTLTVSSAIVDGSGDAGRIELDAHLSQVWIGLVENLALSAVIAFGLSGVAIFFGLRLRRFVTDPILNLALISQRVSRDRDYSIRAAKIGGDEIGALVDHFNLMLAEIQARDEALRLERETLEQRIEERTAEIAAAKDEAEAASRLLREERDLIAAGPSVVFKWAPTETLPITYVSPNVTAVFGHDPADLLAARRFADLIHPDDGERVAGEIARRLASGAANFQQHYRFRHGDGGWRWIDAYITVVIDRDDAAQAIAGYVIDVTARHDAEDTLRLSASVFSHAREGIMITDPDGVIVEVNEAFSRITGFDRDEALGKRPNLLKSGRQGPEFYARLWHALGENGYWAGEVWNRRKNGEVYAELLTIGAVRDVGGGTLHYVALFSDITALKEHQQQLEHIAHYDALTGLPNRVLLADRMRQALISAKRRGQRLAVACIDLDGFKAINDNHGHEAGDQLLMVLASRMQQCLREGDTIARLGGDEFVAVLVDLPDLQAGVPLILRLLAATAQPIHCAGLTLQVTGSIGVSFYSLNDDCDPDQLLRQADQAMYQAKLAGKNRYHVFDAEQDRNVRGHHVSIERIRQALAEGEFTLYYQPKVNLRSGAPIGAEALIRWRHPEQGLLAPALFLHEVEDHPLGIALGEWVIDAALRQIETWQTLGLDLPVSVNIAAHHLQQPNFVERLRLLLAAHPGIRPDHLELEILETSALEDMGHVSTTIAACVEMGVSFALDDFGTGYSSLTYLKRLPSRVLKIDQSFVRDMLDDPDDLAILEGVLGLATAFGREAIAEGVETVAHGEALLRLGCELAQGYGIARPMPAEALPDWWRTWRPDPIWSRTDQLDQDLLPVLFASSEHRAWVRALGEFLDGKRALPPPLDHHHCRFGQWLDGARGKHRQRHAETIADIEQRHRDVHDQAVALIERQRLGLVDEARSGRLELQARHDALLARMRRLLEQD